MIFHALIDLQSLQKMPGFERQNYEIPQLWMLTREYYIPCNKNEIVILKSQDEMAGNAQRKDVCYKKREIW